MISCTDFIPAYSDLFKYLERRGGKQAVLDFWNYLSDQYLDNLRDLVKEKGIRGCWEYWSHSLNEEAADFTMELDEEKEELKITMHHCPSKGRFLKEPRLKPYHDYCGHCAVLYHRVLEPFGFIANELDLSQADKAACIFVVKRKS
jgi:hypothetical protein